MRLWNEVVMRHVVQKVHFRETLLRSVRFTTVKRRAGLGEAEQQIFTLTQFNDAALLSLSNNTKQCYRYGTHFVALVSLTVFNSRFNICCMICDINEPATQKATQLHPTAD